MKTHAKKTRRQCLELGGMRGILTQKYAEFLAPNPH